MRGMAQTKIKLTIAHPIEVRNVDVEMEVRHGQELLGKVLISRGGLDWYPSNARKARKKTWRQLADWMER